jgi:hypothetical protein
MTPVTSSTSTKEEGDQSDQAKISRRTFLKLCKLGLGCAALAAVGYGGYESIDETLYDKALISDAEPDPRWVRRGIFLSPERLEMLKSRLAQHVEPTWTAFQRLRQEADEQRQRQPSVPEDWYVPGYYRDAAGHRRAKNTLADDANSSYTLALCYRMTGDEEYAHTAATLIDAWATHLKRLWPFEDSQLSFSYHFPALILAEDLLQETSLWSLAQRETFRNFVRYKALPMNTMRRANNWGNWGLMLVISCAVCLGATALFERGVRRWREFIEYQIAEDGHLIYEVSRNDGKGDSGIWYSHFSLMPQTLVAEIAHINGVELYDYVSPSGHRLRQAFDRLAPWANDPASFPYYKGADPSKQESTDYVGYFEILNVRWPNSNAIEMLQRLRPLSATHCTPHLTFTHGNL